MTKCLDSHWTGVKRILIANRSECASRIIKTAKKLGLTTIAIFAPTDIQSLHVKEATISKSVSSYLAEEDILQAAEETRADSIHPGYGFLSENPGFARKCTERGLQWLGPSPDVMEKFSSKTKAREFAESIGVPCTPGSPLLNCEEDAVKWASLIGYPVVLKASGGGGGIGIQMCRNSEEVVESFTRVRNLGQKCFADDSVFLEKYVMKARHIEVQVFGDGTGEIIHLGERECSTQRRYQKIIEETPSPALTPALREKICAVATKLCSHVKYESAGTVEFVLDDDTKEFFFIEVNTRIQVEHGITEMVSRHDLDLVEWMIRQGHPSTALDLNEFKWESVGSAIQLRIYAEDPAKDFRPSPGIITDFQLPDLQKSTRAHVGIFRGFDVSTNYDPLMLKVLQWAPSRSEAIQRLKEVAMNITLKGPSSNLEYLIQVIDGPEFLSGQTFTKSLSSFDYEPRCLEVLKAGMSTTIQDYPGRIKRGLWRIGVPPSGPLDHLSSRIANRLVGNPEDAATLEVTIQGPTLKFYKETCVAIAGPPFAVTLNGVRVSQFACLHVNSSDVLAVGSPSSKQGVRCYIAVKGGIDVAKYLGSRSTFEKGKFGGNQGRKLLIGDMLDFGAGESSNHPLSLEKFLWPAYTNEWRVGVLPGPHANPDFMTDEDIEMLHDAKWKVHHNSNRLGIRLIGSAPTWARLDGGEGGSHPSNIHDCVYAMGTINFTGDMPIIIAHDGPSLGGFVCPITIVSSEIWKIGQMKAGDTVQFECWTIEDAISNRIKQNNFIQSMSACSADEDYPPVAAVKGPATKAILVDKKAEFDHPGMQIRLAGDSYVLVEYGAMKLDILLRIRIHFLEQKLLEKNPTGLIETAPGVRSLQIFFNPLVLPLPDLIDHIVFCDSQITDISSHSIETRVFHLPLAFDSTGVQEALEIYSKSVRSEAPYLPSNIEFIARNNGVTAEEVYQKVHRASYMCLGLGDVYLGACCAVPTDPRDRLINPKFNPARTYTQEGTVGLGGAYMCIYPMDSPGGYQLVGRTLPIWNTWALNREVFSPEKPWLLEMFDQIRFYHVEEAELDHLRKQFYNGSFLPKIEKELFVIGDYLEFLKRNEKSISEFQQKQQEAAFIESQTNPYAMSTNGLDERMLEEGEASKPNASTDSKGHCGEYFEIRAMMTANIWSIKVKPGDIVSKDDTLAVLGITHKIDEQFVNHQVSKFSIEWNPNVELSSACGCALSAQPHALDS